MMMMMMMMMMMKEERIGVLFLIASSCSFISHVSEKKFAVPRSSILPSLIISGVYKEGCVAP
jgi:hypothetical protein